MPDVHGDVLTGGGSDRPAGGTPSPATPGTRQFEPLNLGELDEPAEPDDADDLDDLHGRSRQRWVGALRSLYSAEALAVAGVLLLVSTLQAQSLLTRLAAATLDPPAPSTPEGSAIDELSSTFHLLSGALCLLAVVAAGAALVRTDADSPRWLRGLAGATVLVGLLLTIGNVVSSRVSVGLNGFF